ncbi:MAG: hypothetical protein K2M79_03180 [Muribaculaceae bacterium]|nr:hypothetical protein [Muribaculaceae bacterium]
MNEMGNKRETGCGVSSYYGADGVREKSCKGYKVEKCVNLRPTRGADGNTEMRPASGPGMCNIYAWKYKATAGKSEIFVYGSKVGFLEKDSGTTTADVAQYMKAIKEAGTEKEYVRDIFVVSADEVEALGSHGLLGVYVRDASGSWSRREPDRYIYERIRLYSVAGDVYTAMTPRRKLSREYSAGESTADAADVKALSADFLEAYSDVTQQMNAAGEMPHPALCRVKLYNRKGAMVYSSAPVLLMYPGEAPGTLSMSVRSADGRTAEACTVQLKGWRVGVELPMTTYSQSKAVDVERMEVWVSDMFEPVDYERRACVRGGRSQNANELLSVYPAGSEYGLYTERGRGNVNLVRAVSARLDSMERCISTVYRPLGQRSTKLILDAACTSGAAERTALMRERLRKKPLYNSAVPVYLRAPHSVSWKNSAVNCGDVLVCEPESMRYEGYYPASFGTYGSVCGWEACVEVLFSDGGTAVRQCQGLGASMMKTGAVLSYPAADAVQMTVTVRGAEGIFRRSFPLSDDGSGCRSIYVSEDFMPVDISKGDKLESFEVPEAVERIRRYEGMAALLSGDYHGEVKALSDIGGTIHSVVSGSRTHSGWEYGRTRFYTAGSCGIHMVSADKRSGIIRSSLVDSTPVKNENCVASGREIYVAAGDRVLRVRGNGTEVMFRAEKTAALIYNPGVNELAAVDRDGVCTVWCPEHEGACYQTSVGAAVESTAYADEYCYVVSDGRLLRTGQEASGALKNVSYSMRLSHPRRERSRVRSVSFHVSASQAECVLSVWRCDNRSAGCARVPMSAVRVSGPLHGRISVACAGRESGEIRVSIEGSVSADFRFNGVNIYCSTN